MHRYWVSITTLSVLRGCRSRQSFCCLARHNHRYAGTLNDIRGEASALAEAVAAVRAQAISGVCAVRYHPAIPWRRSLRGCLLGNIDRDGDWRLILARPAQVDLGGDAKRREEPAQRVEARVGIRSIQEA